MRFDWLGRFARMPEKMWRRLEALLPRYRRSPKGGRPRANLRDVVNGIFYLLRTGCQWKALPPQFGAPAQYIGTSRNGTDFEYFTAFGKSACERMTRDAGSDGAGKRWTGP